jgi:hypothetical protein
VIPVTTATALLRDFSQPKMAVAFNATLLV